MPFTPLLVPLGFMQVYCTKILNWIIIKSQIGQIGPLALQTKLQAICHLFMEIWWTPSILNAQYWSPDEIFSFVFHVCAMFDQYNSIQNGTPTILKCHQHDRITKCHCAVSPTPECVWDTVILLGLWNVSCSCNYSPASGGLPLQGNFLLGGRQLRHDKHAKECSRTSE